LAFTSFYIEVVFDIDISVLLSGLVPESRLVERHTTNCTVFLFEIIYPISDGLDPIDFHRPVRQNNRLGCVY
jgi:hypothetical protein